MRKLIVFIASIVMAFTFASSVAAAVKYETKVTASVNFRESPSVNAKRYRTLSPGEYIHVISKVNQDWLKIRVKSGTVGYVSAGDQYTSYGDSKSGGTLGSRVVSTAKSYIGDFKYRFGAEPWNTNYRYADCSSFTELVFRKHGIDLPRTSRMQSREGKFVSRANLKKGDLVFFDTDQNGSINHVGIYIGSGDFIHASPVFNGVGKSSIHSSYWSKRYVTARDVI